MSRQPFSIPDLPDSTPEYLINLFEGMARALLTPNPPSAFSSSASADLGSPIRQTMDDSAPMDAAEMLNLLMLMRVQHMMDQERDENRYFTPQNKQIAELEIRNWCTSNDLAPALVKLMAKRWVESGKFPSLDELIEYFYQRACICLRSYRASEQLTLIRISRMVQMMISPEEFHQKDKNHVPTPNLAWIKAEEVGESDAGCALCQNELSSSQLCYRLQPCKHLFHANSEECLGTCSILDWLNAHRTCPTCRAEILVEKDTES